MLPDRSITKTRSMGTTPQLPSAALTLAGVAAKVMSAVRIMRMDMPIAKARSSAGTRVAMPG
jgi:hypothetical protein